MKRTDIEELVKLVLRVKHCKEKQYDKAYNTLLKKTAEHGLEWDILGREPGKLYTDYILRIPGENAGAIISTDGFSSFGTVLYLPEERSQKWLKNRNARSRKKQDLKEAING